MTACRRDGMRGVHQAHERRAGLIAPLPDAEAFQRPEEEEAEVPTPLPESSALSFVLQGLRVENATVYSEAELRPIYEPLIGTVVVGKRDALELVLAGILAGGHVLPEDLPGLGKTLTARSFAQALGLDFRRLQFTPDLLPADVTGSFLYDLTLEDLVGRDTGTPLDSALFLLPGDNLSNAPELTVTGSVTWTPRIGNSGLSGLVYVDGRLTSDFNTGSDLFPEKEQDSFAVFNARLGIRGPDQRWAIELWAQNLFDQDYQQVAFNAPFQGSNSRAQVAAFGGTGNQLFASFLAEPRTYGITGRFRF